MTDLPHDPTAEKAVLGAAMTSRAALVDVAPLLEGSDFYIPAHETVWDTITTLHTAGQGVDPITVAAALAEAGTLAMTGGHLYLHDLVAAVTTTTNAAWHAGIVRELAGRRRVVQTGTRLTQLGMTAEGKAADLVLTAQAELAAAHRPDPRTAQTLIGDLVDGAIDAIEAGNPGGVPWPWVDANKVLNPASPGQLIVIGARPSVGKSVVCVDVAREAAIRRGITTVLHTLEMSQVEVIHRILAAEARIPLSHIQQNTLREDEWVRLAQARTALAAAPLHIIDTPAVSIADLQASVSRHRPGLLVVDYLQLMTINPKVDRRQGVEELTRGLKLLAKAETIPLVVAAQLNRESEKRIDRRPQMSDLRETGSIENDADVIVLLHQPDKDDPESARAGEMDLIVAKQRNGPTETITVAHQFHYARLVDLAA